MTLNDTTPTDWKELKDHGFIGLIGPILRATAPDKNHIYALQTTDKHGNYYGIVHGGVLTSLLDQVIAITAWKSAGRAPTVTVQMDTRFLGAAKVGDFLEVQATLHHSTRSMMFLDAKITCAGTLIASATAIMKISKHVGSKP